MKKVLLPLALAVPALFSAFSASARLTSGWTNWYYMGTTHVTDKTYDCAYIRYNLDVENNVLVDTQSKFITRPLSYIFMGGHSSPCPVNINK